MEGSRCPHCGGPLSGERCPSCDASDLRGRLEGSPSETVQVDTRKALRESILKSAGLPEGQPEVPEDADGGTVEVDTRRVYRDAAKRAAGAPGAEVLARTGAVDASHDTIEVPTRSHAQKLVLSQSGQAAGGDGPTQTASSKEGESARGSGVAAADPQSSGSGVRRAEGGRLEPGTLVGKYEILEFIARGGMGVVYRARHPGLDRVLALKVMRSGELATEHEKERFLREAESAAKLSHPNIIPVHDIGIDGDLYYFTMDYVEGTDLEVYNRTCSPAVEGLLRIMADVADGVGNAHMRGIIHRDLKPSNILVDSNGVPHIMDFGLAKQVHLEEADGTGEKKPITLTGVVMGTPHYMPPEQAEGKIKEIDIRSDVYSLGVILYVLLTGKRPFEGESVHAVLRQIFEVDPPSVRKLDPRIPWEVEVIVEKAMAKEKTRRYQSAFELKEDLERYLKGKPILARKSSFPYRTRKFVGRHPAGVVAATFTFLAILGLSSFLYVQKRDREVQEQLALQSELLEADGNFARAARTLESLEQDLASWRKEASLRFDAAFREQVSRRLIGPEGAETLLAEARRGYDRLQGRAAAAADKLAFMVPPAERRVAGLRREIQELVDAYEQAEESRRVMGLVEEKLEAMESELPGIRETLSGAPPRERVEFARTTIIGMRSSLAEASRLTAEHDLRDLEIRASGIREELLAFSSRVTERLETLDVEEALAAGSSALDDARAMVRSGMPREEILRRFMEARRQFQKAVERDPAKRASELECALAQAAYLRDLGGQNLDFARFLLQELEQPDWDAHRASIEAFEDSLTAAAAREEAFAGLMDSGLHHLLDEQWELARQTYAKALEDVPRHRPALFGLALSEAKKMESERQFKTAFARYRDARALASDPREERQVATLRLETLVVAYQYARRAAEERLEATDLEAARGRVIEALDFEWPQEEAERVGGKSYDDALAARRELARMKADIESRTNIPQGMVYMPAGWLTYGGKRRDVAAFFAGGHEVTNAEYREFVEAGGYEDVTLWGDLGRDGVARFTRADGGPGPSTWARDVYPDGLASHPVTGICLHEAQAYARWASKKRNLALRLPYDWEWAYLALWDPEQARPRPAPWDDASSFAAWAPYFRQEGPLPVGAPIPGSSGIYDRIEVEGRPVQGLYGNVHEWAVDASAKGVARGGSVASRSERRARPEIVRHPDAWVRNPFLGFRLVASAGTHP